MDKFKPGDLIVFKSQPNEETFIVKEIIPPKESDVVKLNYVKTECGLQFPCFLLKLKEHSKRKRIL